MQYPAGTCAVVTGGASGLGAATARALAACGIKVAIFDMNSAAGTALAGELGGVFCRVDVTSEEQVDAGFAKARAALGQERILVNCAGVGSAFKTAAREAFERFQPQAMIVGASCTAELIQDDKVTVEARAKFLVRESG